ncbi:flagellar biosynthesis sigma factor [Gemmata obscuriglobus]|uniref:RNA polymerase sigma-70 region 2 domain-containing protein n=1 Tax=Gemmata obscuriglobus TaxID=114 RepID=A0A2Z3HBY4_9BACT|nr:sigma-70 family RNA polymerase sigma factor [Gemmata obscuriglobus]AWM38720.1 hypothetical protein C1280_18140 [Gemmata obscuriglobus]QEG28311.1 flagellar biosynthesis sigma factor [Gemmata obscuriglobus]VTS06159.1 hypothetical protein : RNA polymerase sigma factor OS=Faecalibacterium sp. CAG:1138 GN=BN468_01280 PE=3 SV=1: Sigma70_r2 [Gemmata obscuriglobus UQM 2246]
MAAVAAESDADLCAAVSAGRAAADALLKRHEKLIWSCVHRLQLPDWVDRDDIFQAGQVALAHAATKWTEGAGAKFTTYARTAIWNAVVNESRKQQKKATSFDDRPNDPDGSDLLNTLAAPEPTDPPEWLVKGIGRLSPVLRRVVVLHFGLEGEPRTWGEIASATGMTVAVAKRALELALAQLTPQTV